MILRFRLTSRAREARARLRWEAQREAPHRTIGDAQAIKKRLAERHADGLGELPDFDRGRLTSLIDDLRALTATEPETAIPQSVALLRSVGVVLCFVPAVPGLGLYGATRWIAGHPVIQLSLLRKTDDQFWFTLFHA